MKLCKIHYRHKNIYDAKFDISMFRDYTSQACPSRKGNESSNWGIYPQKMGLT